MQSDIRDINYLKRRFIIRNRIKRIFIGLLRFVVVLFWLSPILWMLNISFKERFDILSRVPKLFNFHITATNYINIFKEYKIHVYMKNSLIIAGIATIITIIFAYLVSFGLSRFEFKGKKFIGDWLLSLRMFPVVALVLPFYLLYQNLKLINTFYGLVIVLLPYLLPIIILIMRAYIDDVPKTIDEAARVDGCSSFQIASRVILPISIPSIAVSTVFSFLFSWNEFLLTLTLSGPATKTFTIGMSEFIVSYEVMWGEMCAATIIAILPLLLIVYLLQNYLVTGMTLGAVKK
ncbi:MAG: carbohydrate ABC transporter permease [Actinobacteria bacterium]|nr:carbohydrate ABC transporter permease [Actinomycetota bacterium]MCL5070037.1 carbohydrate ABC transporter permease [Actinomycetota bacterium]